MRKTLAVVALVPTLLLLVACGSSQETDDTMYEPAPEPQPEPMAQQMPPEPAAPPPAPEPPPPPPEPPVISADQAFEGLQTPPPPAAWLTCTADADCAAVEVGCCDHCNGGRVVSVVTKQSKAAQRRYRPRRCPEGCTELGCAAAQPICQQGRCAHRALWMVPGQEAAPANPPAAPANP